MTQQKVNFCTYSIMPVKDTHEYDRAIHTTDISNMSLLYSDGIIGELADDKLICQFSQKIQQQRKAHSLFLPQSAIWALSFVCVFILRMGVIKNKTSN